ncbi:MAG TPA: hypothetical protein VHR86_08840 [Armatimonadota bacterium]|nr:hypothetical protein [Armatimonadota bacterium]
MNNLHLITPADVCRATAKVKTPPNSLVGINPADTLANVVSQLVLLGNLSDDLFTDPRVNAGLGLTIGTCVKALQYEVDREERLCDAWRAKQGKEVTVRLETELAKP